jgi:hypothetical protein
MLVAFFARYSFRNKLRQLGDIHRDPPRLVFREHLRRRPPAERLRNG